ncbi:DNA polymerase alpha-associated DNA helicase A [Choanephora cucurbitarum]|uniref:DNA polymerase alpha-associated DNA helicase A n=1 Tax=Choanephora cucurbitarum TaxID=101091 RepID=A0A1C7MXC9_9FUNG|nr:DNA polymerase alpha-associated DNA helicase A [Choanephora cucurbitarum]
MSAPDSRKSLADLYYVSLGLRPTTHGKDMPIPQHKIKRGSIVSLANHGEYIYNIHDRRQAVVTKVEKERIEVAFYEDLQLIPTALMSKCQIVQLPCTTPFQRMLDALCQLKTLDSATHSSALTSVLLEKKEPSLPKQLPAEDYSLFDQKLNKDQKEAVRFALQSPEIALIHGPPGKTQTLVEIIRQLHKEKKTVLVTGPSNVFVDDLLKRVSKFKETRIVRTGHPARVAESSFPYCLGTLVPKGDMKSYQHDMLTSKVISEADVVFSTLCGSGHNTLKDIHFDVTIIDEASQASEPDCWIAILKSKKAVLAADYRKSSSNAPSTKDNKTIKKGMRTSNKYSYSLFERLLDTYGDSIKRTLQIKY